MKTTEQKTYFFTFIHATGSGQYSGPDKKYIQSQRNAFKRMGYKTSQVIQTAHL